VQVKTIINEVKQVCHKGVLGFKYEQEKGDTGMTGLAGLPVYLDLLHAMGLSELIGRHLQVKQRGWTDAQMVLSLTFLLQQFDGSSL
jgi:hypothetical protein